MNITYYVQFYALLMCRLHILMCVYTCIRTMLNDYYISLKMCSKLQIKRVLKIICNLKSQNREYEDSESDIEHYRRA